MPIVVRYRGAQERVIKALQQAPQPGTRSKLIEIEGNKMLPRMSRSRRPTVAAGGSQEYVHSGLLMGEKGSVGLVGSSCDENAAGANCAQKRGWVATDSERTR